MLRSTLVLCLSIAAAPSVAPANPSLDGEVFTFGIVPQQSASRLAQMWGPLLNDIAYMNPMHYAIFSDEVGYQAIARQSEKRLRGVIVARVGSEFSDVSSLDGETLAFPSPGAFGASILNRSYLSDEGVAFDPAYVNSHDSVYRAVAAGIMPAGGGVTRTLNSLDPELRAQLTVIHETEGFTPHAIAVLDQDNSGIAEILQQSLMGLADSHPELIEGIGMNGFEMAYDADWDDVRALEMSRAETGILSQGDAVCPLD